MFEFITNAFVTPVYLILILIVMLAMFILTGTDKRLFITRTLILLLLIIALAEPFSPLSIFGGGNSKLVVLEDNSSSYNLYGESFGERYYNELGSGNNVAYSLFGESLVSDVGDASLEALRNGNNILLLSDGNVNYGEGLEKVKERAILENLSISTVRNDLVESDYAIKILGPSKVGPDTDSTFTVVVEGTDNQPRNIELIVDGKSVASGNTGSLEYENKFSGGHHRLTAKILDDDYFNENNIYYKSLKVVEKPKVLFFGTEGSPLYKTLDKLYDVETGNLNSFGKYHAVVIDNKDLNSFSDKVGELKKYVEEGNGLLVVGGDNSFEYGDYSGSKFEDLIPVKVSGVGKKESDVNVIILIDISSSAGEQYGTGTAADVAKSLAASVLNNIDKLHSVGVVAFNQEGYLIEDLGVLGDKDILEVQGKISSLEPSGTTNIANGLFASMGLLDKKSGGKNIILITDGNSQGVTNEAVSSAVDKNVKIYGVAIGANPNEQLLRTISESTNGTYYHASQAHQLSFVFGDPDKAEGETSELNIEDDSHFITEDLFLSGIVDETNEVIPKNSAQLLITTGEGNPVLSTWRVGLGRIAVLSTDDGNSWGGELYSGQNSKMISRTVNWATGDPERKNKYFFSVNNPRVGEEIEFVVKSDSPPVVSGFDFDRKSDGTYVAKEHANSAGFFSFGDDEYNVNYNREYEKIGLNKELENLVVLSGGKVFEADDSIKEIAEFMKEKANILEVDKELFIWPLIALAMVIFILDVFFRTIQERKNI